MTGVGRGFGAVLLAAVAACSVFGIVTITRTPVLTTRSGEALTASEISRVRNVAGIEIPPAYFLRFPEFRAVAAERQWWTLQREVAGALTGRSSVVAALEGPDGQRHRQTLRVAYPDVYQAIKSSWLIYLAVVLYCVIAWSVYSKHKTAAGTVLGLFCLWCALYCATSAPIVGRGLVVPFPQFRWLMDINYVADSGLVTVIHFALLFPERKPLLDRWPVLWVIYGYFAAVNILYLGGFTAYDASLPFLYVWSFILFLAFVHSMVREKDPFLRRQVLVSIAVPALVAIIFIVFNADPSAMGTSSTRFATFVIFALLMPFALMSAMDNILLYRQRLAAEAQSHQEREKVRQALHDDTLNKLANIALLSETTLQLLGGNEPQVRDKLQSIKQQATGYSQTIRELLCVTDRRYGSWEDFSSLLRSYGYDATTERDVAFDLAFTREPGTDGRAQLSTAVTVTLYHIFVEALANALRHANPRSIHARLHLDSDRVSLTVTDDGDGFQGGEIRPGHYGVGNMTERARAMNGVLSIDSRPGAGTLIEATLPLGDTPGD
ncbi:MAG: sensor histidine kinase [Gammaproteobacteria bacterium]